MLKPVPMARMAAIGLRKDKQVIVSILHDLGAVKLEPLSKDAAAILSSGREGDPYREVILSDQLLRMRALKAALPPYPVVQRHQFKSTEELLHTAKAIDIDSKVGYLERQKDDLLTQLKDTENNLRLVEEFSFFPEDLRILHLLSAHSYFGRAPSEKFVEFKKALEEWKKDVVLYYKEDKKVTHFVLVILPNFPTQVLASLVQSHSINLEPVPDLNGKPSNIIQDQKNQKSEISNKLQAINGQLLEISKKYYATIVSIQEQLEIENKKSDVTDNFGLSADALALEGWAPKSKLKEIRIMFERYTQSTTVYELKTAERPPTLLANPKRFRVFESFVRFYSMPSGDEFDPTLIFGLLFPVFYGMMLGDVGYGAVILLVSLWVIRRVEGRKRDLNIMPKPLRNFAKTIVRPSQMVKLAKAMIPGAIIAIILGFIFNLYFGFHLNGYLFHYAQGLHFLPSSGAFLDPVGTFGLKKLLLLSGYIGLGMVSFGLILGILNNLREGQKRHMIGKVGWLLFGWGIVLTGLALLHHSHINPIRHVQGVVYFGLILGGIGLMFYGEGVRAVMELPSIISHILSYTRIVGILLASVILADVIDFIFIRTLHHTLPYIVLGIMIFFIGHIFNIILGVFEPGIQGARLLYVEFFSKFYHGNGR
ncbi:MAG TPA: V-type ATPase 116kDa subunit family protein, partial [Candidatus Nitrosopolaris rasttigaisensis]|nr:V-type ATPase 116kDa subunit family protein [Candidatus Nitrosopolaris rasttigaisensis]